MNSTSRGEGVTSSSACQLIAIGFQQTLFARPALPKGEIRRLKYVHHAQSKIGAMTDALTTISMVNDAKPTETQCRGGSLGLY